MAQDVLITRGTGDVYSQSFDLWAQAGRYPICAGDGQYVANVPIDADQDYVAYSWTPPSSGTWKLIAIPIRHEIRGIPVKVTDA